MKFFNKKPKRLPKLRKTKKPQVSAPIKQYVKSAISRRQEDKEYIFNEAEQLVTSAGSGTVPYYRILTPTLATGANNGQRIGNMVRIKYSYLRGTITLKPIISVLNPLVCPVMCKIWIVSRLKQSLAISGLPVQADWNNMFKGNGGAIGFQGNLLDIHSVINDDYWKCHASKIFMLSPNYNNANGNTHNQNGQMFCNFYFNTTKFLKTLKFNDGTTSPTNRELFYVVQAVQSDGTTSTSFTTSEITSVSKYVYEDA